MNKDSSVGITEDMITNIMNLTASEYHLNILVRKYEDKLEYWYNGGVPGDETEAQEVADLETNIKATELMLKQVTEARRDAMKVLKGLAKPSGNPDAWCLLKHVLVATITAFEAWQVELTDIKMKQVFLEQSRIANQVLAMFLGYEVTPCSACLTDQLEADNK